MPNSNGWCCAPPFHPIRPSSAGYCVNTPPTIPRWTASGPGCPIKTACRIGGCGTWAGVPYLCTPQAFSACQYFPSVIDVDALVADTHEMFANGSIDDPANMADDRIYAFTGTRDMVARWL